MKGLAPVKSAAPGARAFTLVELLVVVTLIVILIAMLAPALDQAMEATLRAKCATQLRIVHQQVTEYTSQNRGVYFICRLRSVQHGISNGHHQYYSQPGDDQVNWIDAAMTVGLAVNDPSRPGGYYHQTVSGVSLPVDPNESIWPAPIWDCPSGSPDRERFSVKYQSLVLGYQYFGGITLWSSPFDGTRESRAPVRVQDTNGSWVLAADRVHYSGGRWIPNHRRADGGRLPAGGNQVYINGSVEWVDFFDMALIHSWDNNPNEFHLFKQNDVGPNGLSPNAQAEEIAEQFPG